MAVSEATSGQGAAARRLIRGRDRAALATSLADRPYVSFVIAACDSDASPLLLLSDLAQHTKNLIADPQVSLLFEDTGDYPDPLAGPRLTLLGRPPPAHGHRRHEVKCGMRNRSAMGVK